MTWNVDAIEEIPKQMTMSGWLNIPVYGALVRLITPVYETERLSDAETRLQTFTRDLVPVLDRFLPG